MRIPRHWQRARETADIDGKPFDVYAWGFSDDSPDDARRMAAERLPRIREAIAARSLRRSYDYLADPIREHRIKTWGPEGEEHTVITRNGYGALVLNVVRVMFIDIDVPPGWRFLFWGKSTQQKKEEAADRVESYLRSGPPVMMLTSNLYFPGRHSPDRGGQESHSMTTYLPPGSRTCSSRAFGPRV